MKLCDRLSQGLARLLNPQSYIIASLNSQLKDSVSIGLAAFPDKIYTDNHNRISKTSAFDFVSVR